MSCAVMVCTTCSRKIPGDARDCAWCAGADYATHCIAEAYR